MNDIIFAIIYMGAAVAIVMTVISIYGVWRS